MFCRWNACVRRAEPRIVPTSVKRPDPRPVYGWPRTRWRTRVSIRKWACPSRTNIHIRANIFRMSRPSDAFIKIRRERGGGPEFRSASGHAQAGRTFIFAPIYSGCHARVTRLLKFAAVRPPCQWTANRAIPDRIIINLTLRSESGRRIRAIWRDSPVRISPTVFDMKD
jgi:hypothetical protein